MELLRTTKRAELRKGGNLSNRYLVMIAHGSKNPRWLSPFEQLADALRKDSGDNKVSLCYMEHSKPALHDVVKGIAERGVAAHVRILPLFMATGNHLEQDIPAEIAKIKVLFPQVQLELLPPIGEHLTVMKAMRKAAQDSISSH